MKPEATCIDLIGVDRCTGCFGCQTSCHSGAIYLALDAEGFYKPVVNRDACNHCGLCQKCCPVIAHEERRLPLEKWSEPKAFASWSLDNHIRLFSTSGGLFSELARRVISSGGAVAGCSWGPDWTPRHVLTRTWPEVEKMRGSKYVPSHVGNTYAEIVQYLQSSSTSVFFVGTPCQVAAMDLALNPEQRERVLLVDFICHGVPSLRVFHNYLHELFNSAPVVSYLFREKSFGWEASSVRAESVNGDCHHVRCWLDPFVAGTQAYRLYDMTACHACAFARLPRHGDITIGDFWGCPEQWKDKRGVSVVLANTTAGLCALEDLNHSGRIALEPTDIATVAMGNQRLVTGVSAIPENRRAFLDGIVAGKSFKSLKSKYFPKPASKWRSWWLLFRSSDAKLKFLSSAFQRQFLKLVKRWHYVMR